MKLIVFLSLILCLSAVAQPNPINRRAMAIAGLAQAPFEIPSVGTNIWLRLKSSDLTMSNAVTSWVDEISGRQFNQGDNTKLPTNTVNGVQFDGTSEYLTNVPVTIPQPDHPYALLIVMKLNTAGTAFGGVILHNNNFGINTDGYYLGGGTDDNVTQGNNGIATVLADPMGQSKKVDFFTFNGPPDCFTNGISTAHNNAFGNIFTLDILGDGSSHNAKFKGTIQEIIIWTNILGWGSVQVSNVHYYVTNTYTGISP